MSFDHQRIDLELQRLGAKLHQAQLAPTADPMHANLQRLLASELGQHTALDAMINGLLYRGVVVIKNGACAAMTDGRIWTEFARHADVHIAIGIVDTTAPDPDIFRASVEENWDDSKSVPLPAGLRRLCSLSEFLAYLEPRKQATSATNGVANLRPINWTAPMTLRPSDAVRASGPAALGRARMAMPDPPVAEGTLLEGVAVLHHDGRVETVALNASHANIVTAFAWAGDDIVVVGQRKMRLTHLGVMSRHDEGWTAREVWAQDPTEESADAINGSLIAASRDVLAFTSRASQDRANYDVKLHVWHRKEAGFQRVGTMIRSSIVAVDVDTDGRVWIADAQGIHEVRLDGSVLTIGTHYPMPMPMALANGNAFVSNVYERGIVEVWRAGVRTQELRFTRGNNARMWTAAGWFLVTEYRDGMQPATLHGFTWSDSCYEPAFVYSGVSITESPGPSARSTHPNGVAIVGQTVFLGFEQHGARTLTLPPQ
jgi:hypothetical protein